jgi:integrase
LGHRIREVPRGLLALKPYNEKADRQYVRRALSPEEVERLFTATRQAPPWKRYAPGWPNAELTGEDRVMLYTIAMATGFRANELRSLTLESFQLTGDKPTITVSAAYSKRGRNDEQPIRREDASAIKAWLDRRAISPGQPVMPVPEKTALMLREDLQRAKIPHRDSSGRVMDFHGLRHTYITNFARQGIHPKIIQSLARHSTVSLTLDRYTHLEDADVRDALENGSAAPANGTAGGKAKPKGEQRPKPRRKTHRQPPKR